MGMTMTSQTGYASGGRSRVGLVGAIAVHAVAVGAIMLMPAEIITRITDGPLITYNDPLPKPPPITPEPAPPEHAPHHATVQSTTPEPKPFAAPDTVFQGSGPVIGSTDIDPFILPGGDGAGAETRVEPTHDPVFTDAGIDQRFARNFQPAYPPAMQRLNEEGKVVVRVRIGTDGRVVSVERVSASSDAFWEATQRQALRAWRFRPATRDGVPVESVKVMVVHFQLQA
ncbi:energy transducer TonB [Sphingobium sp. H39-3-25]|uniref:energy transducer TonB n=1 Tax=Sphingobium arseniciresistens TaxID=3030834 RepID=UPI0023B9C8B6|nr:energy transducer TonB [Sphingobium arseniciresistens]